jgi:hypothetical protein
MPRNVAFPYKINFFTIHFYCALRQNQKADRFKPRLTAAVG